MGGPLIIDKLRSAAAAALVLLVFTVAAPVAIATVPRASTLRLVSPSRYQVFQRGDDGLGSILITGRAVGVGRRLQVRWGNEPCLPFSSRRDGEFALRLGVRHAGQATLQVRSVDHHSVVVNRQYVGVGDIYVIAGQSNASGRGSAPNSYSNRLVRAALFGNDDRWKNLTDPVDSPVGQVDRVSADSYAAGSVWPLLATELMSAEGVPVAFVPCARGTTAIGQWVEKAAAPHSRTTLYGSMLRRVRAVGGRVRAVLFWQGERDARLYTSEETYAEGLRSLSAALTHDCGAPLVAAQIGDYSVPTYSAKGVDAIRLAQQDAWRAGWALPGPALYDIDLHGNVHFVGRDDERIAARRWAAAILAAVLHRAVPSAPRLESALYDGGLSVTLRFDCGGFSLRPGEVGGLVVRAAGELLQVVAQVTSADTVTLMLAAPPGMPLTVSLGSGRESAGQPVPTEASPWVLPAQAFVDAPVAMSPE